MRVHTTIIETVFTGISPADEALLPLALVLCLGLWLGTAACLLWTMKALRQQQTENRELVGQLGDYVGRVMELSTARDQLNPHFLFNSLNTIRYFVRTDASRARTLLLDLSEYLKSIVDTGDKATLGEELDRVSAYLNLEQARLGERMQINFECTEVPSASPFPTRVIQPLLALVMRRVPQRESEKWWLTVTCVATATSVEFTVTDTSSEPPLSSSQIEPLQRRLERLCLGATMTVEEGAGQRVRLSLPKGALS